MPPELVELQDRVEEVPGDIEHHASPLEPGRIDDPQRGFSFLGDGPLDMRMDQTSGRRAADWLAHADEAEIADVLHLYGEERFARRIARALVARRQPARRVSLSAPSPRRGRDRPAG